jgi:anti-anti-sigma factor
MASNAGADARLWWTGAESGCIAHLEGEIDLANASDLFSAIRAGRADNQPLIVDLTNVTFLDSTGVAEVVRLARETTVQLVSRPNSRPRRVLQITGVEDMLTIFDTVDVVVSGQRSTVVRSAIDGRSG